LIAARTKREGVISAQEQTIKHPAFSEGLKRSKAICQLRLHGRGPQPEGEHIRDMRIYGQIIAAVGARRVFFRALAALSPKLIPNQLSRLLDLMSRFNAKA